MITPDKLSWRKNIAGGSQLLADPAIILSSSNCFMAAFVGTVIPPRCD